MSALEHYLNGPRLFDPLVDAFLVHYQFETIHPFGDGNGRVGRLLLVITIQEWCCLSEQWLYMSAYYDRHKDDYIDRLFAVSARADWTGWIRFCLEGVVSQCIETEIRCERLLRLGKTYRERLQQAGGSGRLNVVVEDLFVSPVVQVATLQKRLNVTYPTAKADLERLASLGILRELAGISPKSYFCPEIFEATFSDTFDKSASEPADA